MSPVGTSAAGGLRGRAFVGGRLCEDAVVLWDRGLITEVDLAPGAASGVPRVSGTIVPGFVDVHVHGGAGADFMDATPQAVRRVAAFHARHGTAALAATTLSASDEAVTRAVDAIAEAAAHPRPDEAGLLAIHLEGPYLNAQNAGAQDRESLRAADPQEVERWRARAPHLVWRMTVAPEVPGVLELIEKLRDHFSFCIGHTSATYDLCQEALQRGATHFTHLFNAMAPLHHREPGPVGAALVSPRASVELIADGLHVHPALLASVARLMPGRVALVTDAMRACGMPDGTYGLYRHTVSVRAGEARLADGTLAGSVLTMAGAVRNMVLRAGMPLQAVLPLATEVPARLLQAGDRKGRLQAGADADVLVLSEDLGLEQVFLRGQEIDCR